MSYSICLAHGAFRGWLSVGTRVLCGVLRFYRTASSSLVGARLGCETSQKFAASSRACFTKRLEQEGLVVSKRASGFFTNTVLHVTFLLIF